MTPTPRDRRRDRVEKTGEYARFVVRWYWILDPEDRTLEILELQPDGAYALRVAASTWMIQVPGCQGLKLDLEALWADAERMIE